MNERKYEQAVTIIQDYEEPMREAFSSLTRWQRVQLARTLAVDPEVIFMDEPFGALDPLSRDRLRDHTLRAHGRCAPGDKLHIPHDPPVVSERISVTVQ